MQAAEPRDVERVSGFLRDGTNVVVECLWPSEFTDTPQPFRHIIITAPEDVWVAHYDLINGVVSELFESPELVGPGMFVYMNNIFTNAGANVFSYPITTTGGAHVETTFDVRGQGQTSTTSSTTLPSGGE